MIVIDGDRNSGRQYGSSRWLARLLGIQKDLACCRPLEHRGLGERLLAFTLLIIRNSTVAIAFAHGAGMSSGVFIAEARRRSGASC